jgi:hypothetical protein
MANTITAYDPIFYAAEALPLFKNALGMARRVHLGYDDERKSFNRGSDIQIRKPSTLSTQAGATGTVGDITTEYLTIDLDQWREVKFGLTDKELAYTGDRIIAEHIAPAAYALANYVETKLTGLYASVPWSVDHDTSPDDADILGARKILRDNIGAHLHENIHFGVDSWMEGKLLALDIFSNASKVDQMNAEMANMRGHLGVRYGIEHFVQQTLTSHTSGTIISAETDVAGALVGAHTQGATTISVDGLSLVETAVAGDSFVIAGNSQRYVVTATATLTDGANTAVPIYPALVQDYANDTVVTFPTIGASNFADAYDISGIMFHRNAFALAVAPLPEIGDGAGARMSVVTDPDTGISLRSRLAYDDTNAKVVVTLDILFGYKCINPNWAVVVRRNS